MNYEDYIFHKYKDKVVIRRKFINEINSKFSGVNAEILYKEIVDYQIFYYGSQLNKFTELTCEQIKKGWTNRRNRRNYHGLRNDGRV